MIFLEVGKIEGFWRELLLALCKPVYQLIVYMYELFEVIATAEIITSDTLSTIYNRVGLLLGMYMMFRIILSFIQMLINPDIISDKEKGIGNISKKAILVVVLLGITPFVFNKAIELQNYIVGVETKDNVIAKLIFPKEIIGSEKFGAVLSASLFDSFYRYDDDYNPDTDDNECYIKPYGEADGGTLYSHIINTNGNINAAKACLDNTWVPGKGEDARYSISFTQNGLFALIVGIVVCYMLLSYTLMVGARVIQLAFLRLVAPMAILGYLSPKKDGMFEKWLKMCVTTYVDLFIRMAILFFVVFMVDAIIGGDNGIALAKDFDHMWMVNIVFILALLIFGKKAPELLKELFPSTGGAASLGYGLKSPKKMFDSMLGGNILSKGYDKAIGLGKNMAKGAVGFGIGSLVGGAGNAIRGAINDKDKRLRGLFGGLAGGALAGGIAGAKSKGIVKSFGASNKAATAQNKRIMDWRAAGGQSTLDRWDTGIRQKMGFTTDYETREDKYNKAKKYADAYSSAKKKADSEVDKFASNYYFKDASGKQYSLLELDKMRNDAVHYSTEERALFDKVYNNIHGFARDHAMGNSGAVSSGSVVWDGSSITDVNNIDWKSIKKTRVDNYNADTDISFETSIHANMDYVLSSDKSGTANPTKKTHDDRFDRAKAANEDYETQINNKINDKAYDAAKADFDANKNKNS